MTLVDKIKKDKRYLYVTIAVLLFMFWAANNPEKKTWQDPAVCSSVEGSFFGLIKGLEFKEDCEAVGCVYTASGITVFSGNCKPCAAVNDRTVDPEMCCSGEAKEEKTGSWIIDAIGDVLGPSVYQCEFVQDPLTGTQREVAGFFQDMGLFKDNAKLAYYAALVIGAMMLFMMMGAIL